MQQQHHVHWQCVRWRRRRAHLALESKLGFAGVGPSLRAIDWQLQFTTGSFTPCRRLHGAVSAHLTFGSEAWAQLTESNARNRSPIVVTS